MARAHGPPMALAEASPQGGTARAPPKTRDHACRVGVVEGVCRVVDLEGLVEVRRVEEM